MSRTEGRDRCRPGWAVAALLAVAIAALYWFLGTVEGIKHCFPLLCPGLSPGFSVDEIPDLKGKTAVVTGANSGLGQESALRLLQKGAHVVLACRQVAKGERAVAELRARVTAKEAALWDYDVLRLDMGSPSSIRAFVDEELGPRLEHRGRRGAVDILLLNAGVFHAPFRLTEFGVESQYAVNHVGNQMLTLLLRPRLDRAVASAGVATVTVVSSATVYAASSVGVTVAEVNDEARFNSPAWYAQSKLASALFTHKIARDWKDRNILVNLARPGSVQTDITKNILPDFLKPATFWLGLAWHVEDAVVTQLYAATAPAVVENRTTGANFIPLAVPWAFPEAACNETLQEQLWAFTQDVIAGQLRRETNGQGERGR